MLAKVRLVVQGGTRSEISRFLMPDGEVRCASGSVLAVNLEKSTWTCTTRRSRLGGGSPQW